MRDSQKGLTVIWQSEERVCLDTGVFLLLLLLFSVAVLFLFVVFVMGQTKKKEGRGLGGPHAGPAWLPRVTVMPAGKGPD